MPLIDFEIVPQVNPVAVHSKIIGDVNKLKIQNTVFVFSKHNLSTFGVKV